MEDRVPLYNLMTTLLLAKGNRHRVRAFLQTQQQKECLGLGTQFPRKPDKWIGELAKRRAPRHATKLRLVFARIERPGKSRRRRPRVIG
jgi:hypothetical protein